MSDEPKRLIRNTEKVPYSEVEPILNLVRNSCGGTEAEVMKTIGYSYGNANDWRTSGMVPLRAKYSLLGLAAELRLEQKARVVKQFNYDDLVILFAVLSQMPVSVTPEQRRKLSSKVAAELAG